MREEIKERIKAIRKTNVGKREDGDMGSWNAHAICRTDIKAKAF